jgi:mycofactocin system creatininase family protein
MPSPLADRAWSALPADPLVLLPLGSVEQHGPHLPLHTDTSIAVAVSDAVAERMCGDRDGRPVLVAPPIAYGSSGEHQEFPGTMSIGNDALRLMLVELVRSLSTWAGWVVIVNAHGGNVQALGAAVSHLIYEQHGVAWVPCATEEVDAHAGFTETSLMLHLAPHLVDLSRAVRGNTAPIADLLPAIFEGGVAAVSPSGVLGDPSGACAAEGSRVLGAMADDVVARIRNGQLGSNGCLQLPIPVPGRS